MRGVQYPVKRARPLNAGFWPISGRRPNAVYQAQFEKQTRVRGNEIIRAIADRLKDENLPPDIHQFMEESIAPDQAKK
jgi:hypothetical protein